MNFTDFPITHIITHQLTKTDYIFLLLHNNNINVQILNVSFFFINPKRKTYIYIFIYTTILSKLYHTRVHVLVRAYSKRRWRTIRKKASKEEEKRLDDGLRVFVSRVPVYLFLLWVARALYTLDGLSRFLSLSHTNRQILGSSRLRKRRRR